MKQQTKTTDKQAAVLYLSFLAGNDLELEQYEYKALRGFLYAYTEKLRKLTPKQRREFEGEQLQNLIRKIQKQMMEIQPAKIGK